jgi:hypothetical protein
MNALRRTITISAAALVALASTIPVAGSASACEIVVDSYTGSASCLDAPQPGTGFSIAWLWIGLAAVLAAAAVLLVARRRPLKRLRAPAPLTAHIAESSELHPTRRARIPTPRTAETEGQGWPVESEKHPSSR